MAVEGTNAEALDAVVAIDSNVGTLVKTATEFGEDGIDESYYMENFDDDYYMSLGPADERDQCEGTTLEEHDSRRKIENTETVEN